MVKKKITISIDERHLDLIDKQRGGEKRSTYINNVITRHFKGGSTEGGASFVTSMELKRTLKPIHERLILVDSLEKEVETLRGIVEAKKKR